jgi:hypothetical protein
MKEQDLDKIREIIDDLQCPKDFECYKQRFEGICQVKDVGLDSIVECIETSPNGCGNTCSFHISYGHSHYCKCPLRVYIAKRLNK